MSEPILYRYKPRDGAFITGLPQRDLTATDLAFIAPLDLRMGVESGLYETAKPETVEMGVESGLYETAKPETVEPVKADKPAGKVEVTA